MGANTFSRTVDWRICPEADPVALLTYLYSIPCSYTLQLYLAVIPGSTAKVFPGVAMFSISATAAFRPRSFFLAAPLTATPARGPRCLSLEPVTSFWTGRAAEAIQDMALEPK